MRQTRTVDSNYLELMEKKAAAFNRLLYHYNNQNCLGLADFILNDEYFNHDEEEGDEEE